MAIMPVTVWFSGRWISSAMATSSNTPMITVPRPQSVAARHRVWAEIPASYMVHVSPLEVSTLPSGLWPEMLFTVLWISSTGQRLMVFWFRAKPSTAFSAISAFSAGSSTTV